MGLMIRINGPFLKEKKGAVDIGAFSMLIVTGNAMKGLEIFSRMDIQRLMYTMLLLIFTGHF